MLLRIKNFLNHSVRICRSAYLSFIRMRVAFKQKEGEQYETFPGTCTDLGVIRSERALRARLPDWR